MNAITNGMLQGKLVIVSAPTNAGKTRTAIADVCAACMPCYYDIERGQWAKNPGGTENQILYIATETTEKEIQTSMLAFTAGVEEEHIKEWRFEDGEQERVELAANLFARNHIWIVTVEEPTPKNLEAIIRKYVFERGVTHVYFDYIQPSMTLKRESGSKNTQTYELLEDFARQLKKFTTRYDIFIGTYTQVNDSHKKDGAADETAVRGSKAMIDKADVAMILGVPTQEDMDLVHATSAANLVYTVYKNRINRHKNVKLWVEFDHGTMRVKDTCVTDRRGNILPGIPMKHIERNEQGQLTVRLNEQPFIPLTQAEFHEFFEAEATKAKKAA